MNAMQEDPSIPPRVSVILPVHDASAFLREAVDSIVRQDFADWHLVAIDDGSTDASLEILRSYDDPRITVVELGRNLGLPAALNVGLDMAEGEFVARMDADDVSLPERLSQQLEFMREHPEVGISGAAMVSFGVDSEEAHLPVTPGDDVRHLLLRENVINHPTAIMRTRALRVHGLRYQESLRGAQDYDLWVRAAGQFPIGNVNTPLVRYRIHPGQDTARHRNRQRAEALRVQWSMLTSSGVMARYGRRNVCIGYGHLLRHAAAWLVFSILPGH